VLNATTATVLLQEAEPQRQWHNVVAFTEPSVLPRGGIPSTAPPTNLVLEWAHGYSTTMACRYKALMKRYVELVDGHNC
jgi:hypothetical protein